MGFAPCLSSGAGLGLFRGPFLGLLEAVAPPLDWDDFRAVDETIDERHDTGGVGKYLAPLSEGFVGRQDDRVLLIAPGDDLEEQVGVTGVVGEVADFVDDEQIGMAVSVQAPGEG